MLPVVWNKKTGAVSIKGENDWREWYVEGMRKKYEMKEQRR